MTDEGAGSAARAHESETLARVEGEGAMRIAHPRR